MGWEHTWEGRGKRGGKEEIKQAEDV